MKLALLTALTTSLTTSVALADSWILDADASHLGFGSVKNSYTGEVHSFTGLSGIVEDGKAEIVIDLGSVQTNIDIRNERMVEHVFKSAPSAKLTADIDMDAMSAMSAGDSDTVEINAKLSLLGEDVNVTTDMFVARMSEDRVLVTTNDMLFVATDELSLDGGIDMLKDIAGLDEITRAVPITIRMVFDLKDTAS